MFGSDGGSWLLRKGLWRCWGVWSTDFMMIRSITGVRYTARENPSKAAAIIKLHWGHIKT